MSEDERPPHAVLVRGSAQFSPSAVAGVLAKRAKAPALDFVAPVRRAWGVVAEALPAPEAVSLAAELTAAGQAAVAVPASLMETPPAPVFVSKAELSADGFDLVAGRANAAPERLSWSRLAAVCAAAIEERSSKTITETTQVEMGEQAVRLGLTMATGIPLMKSATQTQRVVETRDRALALDLLFLEPARRLRVDARAFDFSLLGPKMGYGAEANFLALIQELASRAPAALRGKGTRALLAKRPAGESLYESFDDLAREERWLLTLAALRAAL
ncbi:MAG: hypothetical protein KGL74_13480 [Elusimicrobia bacterium]|nr:hypothetical protein [Elusimicrobiota bacterium]MDE2512130.1 hypothetical protein [Elusimicrobiota bacterium]